MSSPPTPEEIVSRFESEYSALVARSARTADPELAARVIALGDGAVRDRFLALLNEGYRFRGFSHQGDSLRIDFDSGNTPLSLHPPALYVEIDTREGVVRHVSDEADAWTRGAKHAAFRSRTGNQEVELRLTNAGLRWAQIKVEGVPFVLRTIGSGIIGDRRRVRLMPDHLDIDVDLDSGPWVTVTLTAKLNGMEQKQDIYLRGGPLQTKVQFALSSFGL